MPLVILMYLILEPKMMIDLRAPDSPGRGIDGATI